MHHVKGMSRRFLRLAFLALGFPYYKAFQRNTVSLLRTIPKESNSQKQDTLVRRFFHVKVNESKYVQVAGAVLFASAIACLSWQNIFESHWTARALLYSSIAFALSAVVAGAQQQMVLAFDDTDFEGSNMESMRDWIMKLTDTGKESSTERPLREYRTIFALQCPLMFLSLAGETLLAALFSVVISPLGSAPVWGDDHKVALFFGIAIIVASISFSICTNRAYKIPQPSPATVSPC